MEFTQTEIKLLKKAVIDRIDNLKTEEGKELHEKLLNKLIS